MTRVALYARYSSDRQNERSIEDQFAVLTRHAQAKGWSVELTFCDAAISGAAMANRPGLNAALAAAQARAFDVLLAEDEDRIARNLEHQAHVFNRLTQLGVAIATLSTDRIGLMEVAFKGLMGQQYLEVLSQKTKRGMHSNAEAGRATGSRIYGYLSSPGGGQEILPNEATVVRRIWRMFADGDNGRDIAATLNRDGIPGPRGGMWNASTLIGSRQRGNGILKCELYGGIKVWNRVEMKKDLATGARISTPRPESEWKRVEVPHLRIVDAETFAAVMSHWAASRNLRPEQQRRAQTLFSGLLKCRCGAGYTSYSKTRLACSAHREKGPAACTNARLVDRAMVETIVIEGLRTKLLSPKAVQAYVEAYREARARRRSEALDRRAPLERKLAETRRRLERAVDQLLDADLPTATIKARIRTLETERGELEAALAGMDRDAGAEVIEFHPDAPKRWAEKVEQLHRILEAAAASAESVSRASIEIIRGVIDRIEIVPESDAKNAPVDLFLYGRLAQILDLEQTTPTNWVSVGSWGPLQALSQSAKPEVIRIQLRRLA